MKECICSDEKNCPFRDMCEQRGGAAGWPLLIALITVIIIIFMSN